MYEFSSKEESLAVNFEYFISDREYKCRRPSLYRYFSEVFEYSPNKEFKCNNVLSVQSSNGLKYNISPSNVYQIHYFFAGPSNEMGSQWGHAMFRIIGCKPGRKVGPECLADISYHPIISFRANIVDVKTDLLKGVFGGYDSRLFILNLGDVVDEYTKGEFRDLESYPINFTETQKENFLTRVLEVYYGYIGTYFFFSNNCAGESMKLIKQSDFKNYEKGLEKIYTPIGLKELLIKERLISEDVLSDKNNALKKGYLYPNFLSSLEDSFTKLKSNNFLNYTSIKELIAKSSALERRKIYDDLIERNVFKNKSILANFFSIEDYMYTLNNIKFNKVVAGEFQKVQSGKRTDASYIFSMLNELQKEKALILDYQVYKGYGIPQEQDLNSSGVDVDKNNFNAKLDSFNTELKSFFSKEFEEVEASNKNKSILLEQFSK